MPKVSVIIPTYNRAEYLPEAIDSVLNQAYQDFEIIVIDDGSTDNTREALLPYMEKIRYMYQENKGISAARNAGIKISNGEYIAFLDSDDIWFPEKLEMQVDLLQNKLDTGVVFSDTYSFDNFGKKSPNYFSNIKPHSGNMFIHLFMENFIPNITVVARKSCFDIVGLFNEDLTYSEDYDMWLRTSKHFNFGFIDKVLAKYRIHENKQTQTVGEINQYLNRIKVLESAINNYPFLKKELGFSVNKRLGSVYFFLGCSLIKNKNYLKARKSLTQSIKLYPFAYKKYVLLFVTFLPESILEKYKGKFLSKWFDN